MNEMRIPAGESYLPDDFKDCLKDAEKKFAAVDAWKRDSTRLCERLAEEKAVIRSLRAAIDAAHDRCFAAQKEHAARWSNAELKRLKQDMIALTGPLTEARIEVRMAHRNWARIRPAPKPTPALLECLKDFMEPTATPEPELTERGHREERGFQGWNAETPRDCGAAAVEGWLSSSTALTDSVEDGSSISGSVTDGTSVTDGSEGLSDGSPCPPQRRGRAGQRKSPNNQRRCLLATADARKKHGAPTKRQQKSRGRGSRYQPYRR
ncbi:uncharacterized protein LY79DRAFT_279716 [Colletotrichum navitas]|uniref:Uncharacterized protein n=1 Tax=Colletotrichum navitas TaxID=681940 RepID=A0AAD8V2M8_9PEZI|nr:uncharacterized protein LY79DRAFT_279716 [Colletotrichum navitas]KAK1584933.1 hypothetical protein LY79DRAFT_279716 [Colletotrichum navitas]